MSKEDEMKTLLSIIVMVFILFYGVNIFAGEHGGKEHGGAEAKATTTAKDIKDAMKNYVDDKSKETGTFEIKDPKTGEIRYLKISRIHERIGKTGNYFYSCADFKDTKSGELLDLDIDVEDKGGKLNVVDVRIHKVEGEARYTYDEHDNRIPLE